MRPINCVAVIVSLWSCSSVAGEFYLGANIGSADYTGVATSQPLGTLDFNNLPATLPITGRQFDSSDVSWSAYAGWAATDWLSIEAGYNDLGQGNSLHFFVPVLSNGGTLAVGGGATDTTVTLSVQEWFLGPKFSWAFSDRIRANAFAAVSSASFEASGSWVLARDTNQPFVFANVPVESPGNEIGFIWGLGLQWNFTDRFALDLAYRRHDTKVLEIDTLTLGILFSL